MYKVVIIDDEPWTRDVVKSLGQWNKLNLEVIGEASDGETGWSLVRGVMPDIVITDVRMPRINGLELIGLMRQEKMNVPVIIISGYDDYEYVHKAMKLGVVDYLLKPIKPEELNNQLQNCINEIKNRKVYALKEIRTELLPDDLQSQCRKIIAQLETELLLRKEEDINRILNRLEREVVEKLGEKPPQSIQISLYYEIIAVQQKYIEQMGYTRNDIFGEINDGYVFGRENTIRDMMQYFSQVFQKAIEYIENQYKKRNRIDTDAVEKYIQKNYREGITLEETADYFHVSKEYLSKVFKTDHNIGFSDYVLKLRMERAKELIMVYNAPLKEIGFMVGYVDNAHFYKAFKKYFQVTPGEMRSSLKNDNKIV